MARGFADLPSLPPMNRRWFRLGRSAHYHIGSRSGLALFTFRSLAEMARSRGTCVLANGMLLFACGRIASLEGWRIPTSRTRRCRKCERQQAAEGAWFGDLRLVRLAYHDQVCDRQRCRWDEFAAAQPDRCLR